MVGESTPSKTTIECGKGEDCHFPNEKETVLTKFHGLRRCCFTPTFIQQ
jgi:hypothetical protein